MKRLMRLTPAAAALALVPCMAGAADYEPTLYPADMPVVEEYKPVEIGTGWYIRGDIGYSMTPGFKDTSNPYNPTLGTTGGRLSKSSNVVNASAGIGYRINDYLRVDSELGYAHSDQFNARYTGTCAGNQIVTQDVTDPVTGVTSTVVVSNGASSRFCSAHDSGSSSAWTGLANAYVDLGTVAGFTPYIGGGLGLAFSKIGADMASRRCRDEVVVAGTQTTTFTCYGTDGTGADYAGTVKKDQLFSVAWAISAGVAYDISKNTKLDFGYRYLSMPGAKTVRHNGNAAVVSKNVASHQFKVGLRYEIW